MIIRYFAWIRERLNRDTDTLVVPKSTTTVADILDLLRAQDEDFAAVITKDTIIRVALDDELVELSAQISDAKELSIFPPMTGG